MNGFQKFWGHLSTITRHRHKVIAHCAKAGILWQGPVSYTHLADQDNGFDISLDVEEAFKTFLEAVAPLGEDYVEAASHALPDRWIDVYETKNKRSCLLYTS